MHYTFKIYRRMIGASGRDGRLFVWFEDTEDNLALAMERAADLASNVQDDSRPVVKIIVEEVR